MKNAIEMASGGMIYIPSFIKIGSEVVREVTHAGAWTHTEQGDLISLLLVAQNKERRLKL
jgi:hypothetical protein